MSSRVVSDIQTRDEGETLYVWYNTDANALRLLHMMNVRFGLLNMAQRILGVTLPNF
jgi:hypothetical protein